MDLETCPWCGTRKEKYYPCPGCGDREHAETLAKQREETERDRFNELREADQERQEFEQDRFERGQAAAEERLLAAQQHQEEFVEALSHLEYTRANPGDYECSSCKYITLKRDASRCPRCRANVSEGYWADVRAKEKEAEVRAKAAADEWKRGEPARLAAAAKQAAVAARLAANRRRVATWGKFWMVYFIYLLPILDFQAAALIGSRPDALLHQGWQILLLLCPGLNWLTFLGLVIFGGAWQILVYSLLIGGIGFIITRSFPVTSLSLVVISGFFIVGVLYTHGFPPRHFIDAIPTRVSRNTSGGKASMMAKSVGTPSHDWNWASGRLSIRGFGPIRIGMTLAEARSIKDIGPLVEQPSGNQNCFYMKPSTAPDGLQFMVSQGRIARIDITTPAYASVRGARVGQTQEMVTNLYSGRLKTTKHKYNENGYYLTFHPQDTADQLYRMEFETDGKQITKFRVGRLPEVEQVEGCS